MGLSSVLGVIFASADVADAITPSTRRIPLVSTANANGTATREAKAKGYACRRWTDEDFALLRKLRGTAPTSVIARRLNRTPRAVKKAVQRLGLSSKAGRSAGPAASAAPKAVDPTPEKTSTPARWADVLRAAVLGRVGDEDVAEVGRYLVDQAEAGNSFAAQFLVCFAMAQANRA
jgi:hypothetical protein